MILMLYTLDNQLLDLKARVLAEVGLLQFSKSSYKKAV